MERGINMWKMTLPRSRCNSEDEDVLTIILLVYFISRDNYIVFHMVPSLI